jgi:ATP-binding cassette subfamily C protein
MRSDVLKLWSLFDRRTRIELGLLLIPILLASLLEMASLGILLPVLQILVDPARIDALPVAGDLSRTLAPGDISRFLAFAAVAVGLLYLLKNGLLLGLTYFQNMFVARKEYRFIADLFAAYLGRPYAFFLDHNSAEIHRNLVHASTNAFNNGLLACLHLALEALTAAAICLLLLAVSPAPAVLTALAFAMAFGLVHKAAAPHLALWGERRNELQRDIIQWINQAVGAIKETKVLGHERYFEAEFGRRMDVYCRFQGNARSYNAVPRALAETLAVAVLMGLMVTFLVSGYGSGEMVPLLGLYGAAALRLMPSLNRSLQYAAQIKLASAPIRHLHAHVADLRAAKSSPEPVESPAAPSFEREIRVEELSFRYAGAEPWALAGVSFSIAKGETVGLVGRSGAGKSTLADLLLGLLPPTEGRILVDGRDVQDNLGGWQRRLGYVAQHVYLADDTLRRNVAFGVADAEVDEARVGEVVRLAHLGELAASLPKGLGTMIGEHGVRLSGGQRQRIGIARALYRDPDVLILDEATSALDAATEQEIAEALEPLRRAKTVVVIAHRAGTIRRCGRLLFLEGGRLADAGSYAELAERNAEFRRLVEESDRGRPDGRRAEAPAPWAAAQPA